MPSDSRDKALVIVKTKGPVLPGQINKDLNVNVLFASAILSELVDSKLIKLSHAKIGGSPVYYAVGQEPRLGQVLYNYLNEKDKETFNLLRQKGVLRDTEQTPLLRVSLRTIKDFATPLEVTLDDKKEIFWKWHLLPDADAESMIKSVLGLDKKKEEKAKEELKKIPERKKEFVVEKENVKTISDFDNHVIEPKKHGFVDFMKEREIETPEIDLTKPEPQKPKRGRKPKEAAQDSDWQEKIRKYLKDANIGVTEQLVSKKGEFEGFVDVASNVGNIRYYCRAKKKAKLSLDDLAAAFAIGQMKGYPVLLLTNGELGKDAQHALPNFKNIIIKKI